jgi:lipopolysaccharide transport system ATP-binding protein
MKPAIEVSGLGKKYHLPHIQRERYQALREVIAEGLRRAISLRRERRAKYAAHEDFWAVRDLDFQVAVGERVGIIGRNGAGKSTLLKLLSRITAPSLGRITLQGRVASLLEVGTGFHPELTGRENIYLNGSILGMSRREIHRKFDEIVAFADIERFLDTPVKRYSSGMYMRLAFSVAAHLEPDILIVDEVLAVGDAEFQRRCIGKMEDVGRQGRTVLFVSHNMGAVSSLCTRAILLEQGRVGFDGPTKDAIDAYTERSRNDQPIAQRQDRTGTGIARLLDVHLRDEAGQRTNAIRAGKPVTFVVDVEATEAAVGKPVAVVLVICDRSDNRLLSLHTEWTGLRVVASSAGERLECVLTQGLPLIADHYTVLAGVLISGVAADKVQRAIEFEVVAGDYLSSGAAPTRDYGYFLVPHDWRQAPA